MRESRRWVIRTVGGSGRGRLGLTGRVLILQFLVSLVAIGSGLTWLAWVTASSSPSRRDQAAGIASALAQSPTLRQDVARADVSAAGALVSGARSAVGADLISVTLSGGRTVLSTSARYAEGGQGGGRAERAWVGHAPIDSRGGRRIGELVVAFPAPWGRTGALRAGSVAEAALLALAIGLAGSMLLARWLRRRTFGLELDELTDLLQEQQATLYGIREGVVGLDPEGRIRFANDEARRLLGLPHRCLRRPLRVLLPTGRLRDIVERRVPGEDLVVVHEDRVLVVTHIPVEVEDHQLGSVVTVADRTESESLLRELDGTLGLTEALRAQAHDFSNRMHTLVGLVELGEYQAAIDFGTELQMADTAFSVRSERAGVGDPVVAALLLAKSAVARERHVELATGPETFVTGRVLDPSDVVTVLGNLVDNAIEAAQGCVRAKVEVTLQSLGADLEIRVADSGPGIAPDDVTRVFVHGYTTKVPTTGVGRGLGLAVVHQLVQRRRGTIRLASDPALGGARFVVVLPDSVIATGGFPDGHLPALGPATLGPAGT